MTIDKEEQEERRATLENDARVCEQQKRADGSTLLDQYHSDIGGRFGVTQHESVTGRLSPKPPPLPSTSPWSGAQPEPPPEPSLGVDVNAQQPTGEVFEVEQSIRQAEKSED
jgi:hypothetical protein